MLTLGEEFDLDKSGVMALSCGILVLRNYVEVFKRRFLLTNSRALMPSRGVNNKSKLSYFLWISPFATRLGFLS